MCEAAFSRAATEMLFPEPIWPSSRAHAAFFIRTLAGGGAERVMLSLAAALVKNDYRIDFVLCRSGGELDTAVPGGVKTVILKDAPRWHWQSHLLRADPGGMLTSFLPLLLSRHAVPELRCLPNLVRYLQQAQPEVMLAALPYGNLVALWAGRAARTTTRIVVSEHNVVSASLDRVTQLDKRWRFVRPLMQRLYRQAAGIVAVSDGVADDLARTATLPRENITRIYNPVVSCDLYKHAHEPLAHPWFAAGEPPVILGVGRLAPQKDFPTLLRAFARVRQRQEARLVILGEGKERAALERLAGELGVADAVDLPGFVANPYAYMARAALFVLSSAHEGLGNVLIEALACGCPVVSTDCPSGPAEILEGGRYGPLVPVGDDVAMADAMLAVLAAPPERKRLRVRGAFFSVERAAEHYRTLLFPQDPQ